MPIYEYRCRRCCKRFEAIRPVGDRGRGLACPDCGESRPERVPSAFAARAGGAGSASPPGGGFT